MVTARRAKKKKKRQNKASVEKIRTGKGKRSIDGKHGKIQYKETVEKK